MDHLQFSYYHNRLITFPYNGKIMTGVVLDNLSYKLPSEKWGYFFINQNILKTWKAVYESGNKTLTRKLMQRVEIANIKLAKRLK